MHVTNNYPLYISSVSSSLAVHLCVHSDLLHGLYASLYTLVCFTGQPGSITIVSSQRPNVIISWTAPTDSERWSVLYRVIVSNVTSNISEVEGNTMTMVVLPDLTPLTNYTLSVFAYTESGCLSDPTSVDITVMESEWCCHLDLMKAIIV